MTKMTKLVMTELIDSERPVSGVTPHSRSVGRYLRTWDCKLSEASGRHTVQPLPFGFLAILTGRQPHAPLPPAGR